ncbi:hypothetical protein CRUP_034741 [Coryphaenoides rupestris]|nr:hypothetical protein CRUP_034741 [Coryphaenoides rupestris]
MEGILHKWTNYISGWQPRWFVLDGDTLSYYDSQEDAWKGCKGSIKISVCEIQVHSTDITRVDLTIPGEQYFYLRAINAAERQKWLVALGTAKACLTDNRTRREKELQENTEALKTKMSELRLYCDLLLQQVIKIKNSEGLGDPAEADEDIGSMVKSTCTTFLKTLEECMQIAHHTFTADMVSQSPPGSPPVATIKPQKIKPINHLKQNIGEKWREPGETTAHGNQSQDSGQEGAEEPERPDMLPQRDQEPSTVLGQEEVCPDQHDQVPPSQDPLQEEEEDIETFFSTMSHRFSDIRLDDDRGIPTQGFLDSCYAIVPVLDNAYGRTLRQYHGWVVRGVFALALRAAPSYESFTAALVSHEGDELKPGFTNGMRRDLGIYLPAMEHQLSILDALYDEYNLESDEVV